MANLTAKLANAAKPQTAAVSPAVRSPAASKPNSGSKGATAPVSADMWRAMIAEAAYYIAEQRGFGYGRDMEDWLLAEKQIDARLSA